MVRVINIDTKTRTIRVSNGKDDLEWFTTDTGSHVPLKKGQSKAEAIKEHFGDGRVWIKVGGAIIPLRDGVSADDIDPKMLATPEEIKQGRAKYDGIKDRQDTARAKAKSSKIMRE